MNSPLVSIGVPSYNRKQTLERTIDCLINQTYTNLEIIISDNCSSNYNVDEIFTKYAFDNRIKFYKQDFNQGAIFNFNFVLEKATGDFFMRLADDDWIDANYIESCVTFLIRNPEYASAYGKAKIYSLQGKYVSDDATIELEQHRQAERVMHYYKNVSYNSIYYGIINKSLLKYSRVEKKIADDWLTVARIACAGKIKLIEDTNSYISEGGISQSLESISANLNFSTFTRNFPFLKVGLNIVEDIVINSPVYRQMNLRQRLVLGYRCFRIINQRFGIKKEVTTRLKRSIRHLLHFPWKKVPGTA
ncbi:MAG: glycosyltransferase family 2 protein [Bacteroidota bacterium]